MKKFLKIATIVCLVLICVMALVACNPDDGHKGEFIHVIYNEEDLVAMKGMLGQNYDGGRFELMEDITISSNWEPIGETVVNSFRASFDGHGHTITYNISVPEPSERNLNAVLENVNSLGLFGVVHSAKIKDLNINFNIEIPGDASTVSIGGLAGVMIGNNEISNVNVSGDIHVTMGNICKIIHYEDGSEAREFSRYEMTGFIGGAIGFMNGSSSLNGINSDVDIDVDGYEYGQYNCAFKTLFVGGVVGNMRTVNLSSTKDNVENCSAKNLTYTGNIDATAAHINVGGVFGGAYRINDGENWISDSQNITARAYERLRLGGVAGMIDRVNVNKTKSTVSSLNALKFSDTMSHTFSVGGLVGYVANYSNVSNAVSVIGKVTVTDITKNYVGGVVGTLFASSLTNATAEGDLFYNNKSIMKVPVNYSGTMSNNGYYITSGGVVGRIYGETTVSNVATKFGAYQGIVGEIANSVEIISIKESEGETFALWLANTMYDTDKIEYSKEGALEDGKQKYRIIHNYTVDNATSTYLIDNVRVEQDIINNVVAVSLEDRNGIGTSVTDISGYEELKNTLNTTINQ